MALRLVLVLVLGVAGKSEGEDEPFVLPSARAMSPISGISPPATGTRPTSNTRGSIFERPGVLRRVHWALGVGRWTLNGAFTVSEIAQGDRMTSRAERFRRTPPSIRLNSFVAAYTLLVALMTSAIAQDTRQSLPALRA